MATAETTEEMVPVRSEERSTLAGIGLMSLVAIGCYGILEVGKWGAKKIFGGGDQETVTPRRGKETKKTMEDQTEK